MELNQEKKPLLYEFQHHNETFLKYKFAMSNNEDDQKVESLNKFLYLNHSPQWIILQRGIL